MRHYKFVAEYKHIELERKVGGQLTPGLMYRFGTVLSKNELYILVLRLPRKIYEIIKFKV